MLTSCAPSIGVAAGTGLLYARSIPHEPRRFLRQSNSKLARFDRPNPRCGVPREFQRARRNAVSTRIAPATFRAYALRVVLRRSSQGDTYDASDIQKELVRLAAGAMTHDRPLTTASAAPRYRHRTNASQTNECCPRPNTRRMSGCAHESPSTRNSSRRTSHSHFGVRPLPFHVWPVTGFRYFAGAGSRRVAGGRRRAPCGKICSGRI